MLRYIPWTLNHVKFTYHSHNQEVYALLRIVFLIPFRVRMTGTGTPGSDYRSRVSFLALLCVPLLLLTCSSLLAQTDAPVCGPSPAVKAALDQFSKQAQAPDQTDYQFWRSRQAAMKSLLNKYPHDAFVQLAYAHQMMGPDPSTEGWPSEDRTLKAIAEYKSLHAQHPDDAAIEYVYATTLIDRDTPTAIKLLDDVLKREPSFAPPDLDLVQIYTSPNFLDRAKAKSYLSAFITGCPANLAGYSSLQSIGDNGFAGKSAAQLRQVIETRTDSEAIWGYQTLWGLEFKSHPRSDYDALRKQVAADVARIRALNLQSDFGWWYTLDRGYQLIGDQKQSKWAETEEGKHIQPEGPSSPIPEASQWFSDHPFPDPDAKEKRRAYWRQELNQTDQWVSKHPKSLSVWDSRMRAMEGLDDVPAADCAATFDKRLQLEEANTRPLPLYWYTYLELADFLSQKNVEPAGEVEMGQKGLDTIEAEWENAAQRDLDSTKDDLDYYPNFYWPAMKARALLYEAEGYTRLNQPREALAALGKANLQLQALNSDMTADESRRQLNGRNTVYHRCEYRYWQGVARVAQLQARNTDAMAYYQSALVSRLESDQMPSPGDKDDLANEAHQLWLKLGGTEDGWNGWYGQRANILASHPHLVWETAQESLPPFRLTDLHGKTWQLGDLKGKVVFLNFWASW